MFEWLHGDPVNGIVITVGFFIFLIIGRNLKLWRMSKSGKNSQTQAEDHDRSHDIPSANAPKVGSPLHRFDARVKFICAIAAVFGAVALTRSEYAVIPIIACVVLVAYSRASLKGYFKRLMYPFYVAIVVAVVQLFTGTTVVATIPYLGWHIYVQGISFAILIFARVLAAASILNLLITVTPMETLLDSLSWFHIPSVILDTTMLMYRYISVVSEEKNRIYKAQESRCGYTKSVSIFRKLGNYGTVGGMLLVKSFDRALKVGDAMVSRGYTGTSNLFSYSTKKMSKKDIAIGVIVILAVVALLLADLGII
jgi:cobalt/nickel transport system permease protein